MLRDIHAPIERVEEDLLGRRALAERIYARLCSDDCPPVMGIYGGWGTGKTSLLKLIDLVNERKGYSGYKLFIQSIDAWLYESVGSLFEPIIVTLKDLAAKESVSSVTTKKYLKRMRKFVLMSASDLALRRLGLSLEDARKLMAEATEGEKRSYLDWENLVDDAKDIQDAFKDLVNVSLEGLKKEGYRSDRMVFFVDNLDRCSPDSAIQLLESIRNFLTVPGCVWVLAVDSDVIASYISKKYEGTKVDGYSYLDKVIPEQYHLSLSPTLDRQGILNLLNAHNDAESEYPLWIDAEKVPQIPKVLVPRRLIKSAGKVREYYRLPLETRPSPEIIINLVFLYHAWPAFYQRFSSDSGEYIRGIVSNFFHREKMQGGEEGSEKEAPLVSLDQAFLDDRELAYFIRTAFFRNEEELSDRIVAEIIIGLIGLREVGLP